MTLNTYQRRSCAAFRAVSIDPGYEVWLVGAVTVVPIPANRRLSPPGCHRSAVRRMEPLLADSVGAVTTVLISANQRKVTLSFQKIQEKVGNAEFLVPPIPRAL